MFWYKYQKIKNFNLNYKPAASVASILASLITLFTNEEGEPEDTDPSGEVTSQ